MSINSSKLLVDPHVIYSVSQIYHGRLQRRQFLLTVKRLKSYKPAMTLQLFQPPLFYELRLVAETGNVLDTSAICISGNF